MRDAAVKITRERTPEPERLLLRESNSSETAIDSRSSPSGTRGEREGSPGPSYYLIIPVAVNESGYKARRIPTYTRTRTRHPRLLGHAGALHPPLSCHATAWLGEGSTAKS